MSTITIRLSEEQKKAIKGFSILKNKSISSVVLEAILNKIEDEEDYELALMAEKDSTRDFKELLKECDIDYDGGYRGPKRLIYSNDGLVFYTEDHYKTFEQLY